MLSAARVREHVQATDQDLQAISAEAALFDHMHMLPRGSYACALL